MQLRWTTLARVPGHWWASHQCHPARLESESSTEQIVEFFVSPPQRSVELFLAPVMMVRRQDPEGTLVASFEAVLDGFESLQEWLLVFRKERHDMIRKQQLAGRHRQTMQFEELGSRNLLTSLCGEADELVRSEANPCNGLESALVSAAEPQRSNDGGNDGDVDVPDSIIWDISGGNVSAA